MQGTIRRNWANWSGAFFPSSGARPVSPPSRCGKSFVYRPAETRQHVAGRAAKRIVDWFCDGSVEALLVGLVDSKMLDRAELQRLAERIAAAQQGNSAGRSATARDTAGDKEGSR